MPKCKVCGTRLAEETTKCPSCGAAAGSTVAGAVSPGANLQKSVCPTCNKQILGEHKYCPDCGADLQAAALKPAQNKAEPAAAQCVHCGTSLPIGAKFCSECGAPQTGSTEATTITKNVTTAKSAQNTASDMSLVSGQKETDIDAFEYEIQDGKYILTKLKDTSLTEVVIPRVFSEIGGYYEYDDDEEEEERYGAFCVCKSLRSVTIPDSVEVIGESAFWGCKNLQSVNIPDSVEVIGESAFCGCENLRSVTIPDSVKVIGDSAFRGCKSLQTVTILDSVKLIGERAFVGCKSLQHITIPHSVEVIGENAFYGCENLQSVTIRNPQFSKSDINRIFKGASNLYGVEVGNKIIKTSLVTRIGSEDTTDILKAIFIGS